MELEAKALRRQQLLVCYKTSNLDKNGQEEAKKLLISGAALVKFKEIIREQGGNPDVKSET